MISERHSQIRCRAWPHTGKCHEYHSFMRIANVFKSLSSCNRKTNDEFQKAAWREWLFLVVRQSKRRSRGSDAEERDEITRRLEQVKEKGVCVCTDLIKQTDALDDHVV